MEITELDPVYFEQRDLFSAFSMAAMGLSPARPIGRMTDSTFNPKVGQYALALESFQYFIVACPKMVIRPVRSHGVLIHRWAAPLIKTGYGLRLKRILKETVY
ncbi:hypothetical protein [Pseudomonas atagonensis]|uniref:hypothetical protein n=1 Tax=Pseudomonas atagonensis TaxID=2609964 RepID=UPI00140AD79D|nr:hypothetical protein [Pseudomonas atagonensis]